MVQHIKPPPAMLASYVGHQFKFWLLYFCTSSLLTLLEKQWKMTEDFVSLLPRQEDQMEFQTSDLSLGLCSNLTSKLAKGRLTVLQLYLPNKQISLFKEYLPCGSQNNLLKYTPGTSVWSSSNQLGHLHPILVCLGLSSDSLPGNAHPGKWR